MVLSTHAVVGATIVTLIPNHPILGVTLAFVSHFVLDAIPHWEYDHNRTDFVTLDFLVGLSICSLLYSSAHPYLWLIGALAAMVPDVMWYSKLRNLPIIKQTQDFHVTIQSEKHPEHELVGLSTQIVTILALIWIKI